MHRHLTGHFVKALILGFFCCLGASAKDDAEKAAKVLPFALKEVHPDSAALVTAISAGTKKAPPGYQVYPMQVTDAETGKLIGEEPILLATQNIIELNSIEVASQGAGLGTIEVLLTKEGGKLLTAATKAMKPGTSRMAVVIEGKCFIAPTVQAVLGRRFEISGLDGRAEVNRVIKALNQKAKK